MKDMNHYATNEKLILEIVEEAKAKYTQFKRFHDACKQHMCITGVETFEKVYWEGKTSAGKITELNRKYKNGKKTNNL